MRVSLSLCVVCEISVNGVLCVKCACVCACIFFDRPPHFISFGYFFFWLFRFEFSFFLEFDFLFASRLFAS